LSLISDAGREEETYDPLFTYKKGEEENYFNLDLENQLHDSRSCGKGGVLQGDGSADAEILETSEGEETTSGQSLMCPYHSC